MSTTKCFKEACVPVCGWQIPAACGDMKLPTPRLITAVCWFPKLWSDPWSLCRQSHVVVKMAWGGFLALVSEESHHCWTCFKFFNSFRYNEIQQWLTHIQIATNKSGTNISLSGNEVVLNLLDILHVIFQTFRVAVLKYHQEHRVKT